MRRAEQRRLLLLLGTGDGLKDAMCSNHSDLVYLPLGVQDETAPAGLARLPSPHPPMPREVDRDRCAGVGRIAGKSRQTVAEGAYCLSTIWGAGTRLKTS